VGPHYEVLVPAVILPPAPADLTACYESMGGPNVCNHLAWSGSSGVTYNVYRNSSSPVPIDAGHRIASGVTETEYTDCGRYKNYYYAVTAVNEEGESDPSNEAQASEPCGSAMAVTLPVLNAAALTESGGEPVVTKYYFHGGKRVAMDRDGVLQYLATDHLGSTSLVLDDLGSKIAESRHYPYGEERWRWPQEGTFPTEYRFTGQRSDSYIKLTVMGARWYDGQIGRWISPDTIIPDPANPQSFNRYSYVNGRPLVAIDPSGHDLLIVGGLRGDMDPATWQEWIMAYKGWSDEQWTSFYERWIAEAELSGKNEVLAAEGIGIFAWGGETWDEANHNASWKWTSTQAMAQALAEQVDSMKEVTLIGLSKGGNLVLQYLDKLSSGKLEAETTPLRVILLAPATNPIIDLFGHAGWAKNEIPSSVPRAVNICAMGDMHCPMEIRNAENMNPPRSYGHSTHARYANRVIASLNVGMHNQAHGMWGEYEPR
jgi:RHS repeat-associated protein